MAQWVGQQGSEAVGTGSNPSLYLNFKVNYYDGKSLMHDKFRYQNLSEPGRVPLRRFSLL